MEHMIKPHEAQYVWGKGTNKTLINSHFLFCRGADKVVNHDIEIVIVRKDKPHKHKRFLIDPDDTEENFIDPSTIYEYLYTYDVCQ